MKICTKCGAEKPETEEFFPKYPRGKNGLAPRCKLCVAVYKKQWCGKNKISIADHKKQYQKANRVEIAKKKKLYQETNKDILAEKHKQYYGINKEAIAENHKAYRKNNIDKISITCQRRRLRKKQLSSTLTVVQWESIKVHFNNKCAYCGQEKKLTIEHFVAIRNLGEGSINNVIPVCKNCNCSKKAEAFSLWYPKQSFYSKKREQKILKFLNYKNGIQLLALF